jgi:hypothetical protein
MPLCLDTWCFNALSMSSSSSSFLVLIEKSLIEKQLNQGFKLVKKTN